MENFNEKNKNTENKNSEDNKDVFSVSEYLNFLNAGFKNYKAKIIGEISDVSFSQKCVYFYLKDKKDGSIIKCLIWKSKYDIYGIELKEGDKILALGCPNMHSTYGFSFITETIEPAGQGELKKAYERLKKKLKEQGLFEESKKRPIPKYAQKIGVITSLKGAVMADFSNNLGKFGFKVKIIDSRVEGQAAVSDLLLSIKTFKNKDIEVLVIMRGGGSLDSMLAFNNELLIREVANFPVPIIAAIGHDKDVPLVALAADLAVSTPSMAATALTDPWSQAILFLQNYERNIVDNYENFLENIKIKLIAFWDKFLSGFKASLSLVNQRMEHAEKIIKLNNPERQLSLGYSIAFCQGKVIKQTSDAKIGENMDLRVTDGTINSEVKNIHPVK